MKQQIAMLERAASVLVALERHIVFTGGATIALYLDEITASEVRPTIDVDCVVEIASRVDYYALTEALRQLGLQECQAPNAPLCRWEYQDLIIDVMPTDPDILGFSNVWYKPGLDKPLSYQLPSGREISIFSVPYLLASKIEAFKGRGKGIFYTSHDFEDIVLILDGCPSLENEVQHADANVKNYLKQWFRDNLANLQEHVPAQLSSASQNSGRGTVLLELIQRLVALEGN